MRATEACATAAWTLQDFSNEQAIIDRLSELRTARNRAQERVDQLGASGPDEILFLDEDWDELSSEDERRCIRATIQKAVVHPPERRGQNPRERIEIVDWGVKPRLAPPIPQELEHGLIHEL